MEGGRLLTSGTSMQVRGKGGRSPGGGGGWLTSGTSGQVGREQMLC